MAIAKNLHYLSDSHPEFHRVKHMLDVFYPDNASGDSDVVIFIHGGTWMSGSKDIYGNLGSNFASKGIVCVIINYRLGDIVNFQKMAFDCAAAVKWVYNNAIQYGGNKSKITLCGHSAGGHLSALISLNPYYFDLLNISNPVKGMILIDAFGLNIGNFISSHGAMYLHYIEKVFTRDPGNWEEASPVNFVHNRNVPCFILLGEKTYPFLTTDNEIFYNKLKKTNSNVSMETVGGKNHVEMITQFNNSNNPLYQKILNFLKKI